MQMVDSQDDLSAVKLSYLLIKLADAGQVKEELASRTEL